MIVGDVQVVCWEIYSLIMGGVLFFFFSLFVHFLPLYTSRGLRKCVGEDSDACMWIFFSFEKKSHAPFKFIYNFWWLVGPETSERPGCGRIVLQVSPVVNVFCSSEIRICAKSVAKNQFIHLCSCFQVLCLELCDYCAGPGIIERWK